MILQSDPPKLDFRLPKKFKRWLLKFVKFVKEAQPLNGTGLTATQTPMGRLLKVNVEEAAAAAAAAETFNLKLTDATAGGVAIVNVSYGTTGGRPAHSTMTLDDGFDVTLTANGVRYILADITQGYAAPLWTSSASAITQAASVTAATATHAYFEIGRAERESDGAGGFRVKAGSIHNECSGSQGVVRQGTDATYIDDHWLI